MSEVDDIIIYTLGFFQAFSATTVFYVKLSSVNALLFFLFFRVIQFKSNLCASPMKNAAQHKNVKKTQQNQKSSTSGKFTMWEVSKLVLTIPFKQYSRFIA